ncbi:MAG: N-carbamoylputrescine amidase [Catonella sp.]|nr:N-carbamoylputrescine amidase [Catonella sp.]MDY6357647.1 N-carbamoylputrescine amidase [Catonella sp.]
MGKLTVAAVQMKCFPDVDKSIENAERLARIAVDKGAKLILLPELFERNYFCQERRYDYYSFAKPVMEDEAVKHFLKFTEETGTVMPISFYEKDGNVLYNTVAMLDSGKYLGIYRKIHIPDDHYYQEKFYFTPGNTGFKVFSTSVGRVGVGICWDQWFPETARALTINGAEIILYPTAIGSEPILETDSSGHWRRTMQGHAAANIVPVVAANRIGTESVTPSKENGGQESSLTFYGSSFITDDTGEIIASAGKSEEEVLTAELDLAEADRDRLEWGLMRDRRPECYRVLADE